MVDRSSIRVKAFAFLPDSTGTRHVVWRGTNPGRGEFHRMLGGGIELGERSEEAVVREIREELGVELMAPRLLGVVENIFEFGGETGHEVVFVYGGRADRLEEVVPPEGGTFHDGDVPIRVEWRPLDDAGADVPLYPDGVAGLLG